MKRVIFLAIFGLLAAHVQSQQPHQTIIRDPNVVERKVDSFHAIEVSNAIKLYLSQGDHEAVAVSAKDTELRDRIRTEVVNGVLKISLDRKRNFSWGMNNSGLRAYVSFTTLSGLSASGASDIYVDGVIGGSKLAIGLSGASDFKGAVRVDELNLDQSGASDILITGSVAGLTTIGVSGASDFKGFDLSTEKCDIHASGASDVRITVNKEMSVHASGASSVDYKGTPVIREVHCSGASNVSKKD